MQHSKAAWFLALALSLTGCGLSGSSSSASSTTLDPLVPAGNMTSATLFYYGDRLYDYSLTTTGMVRSASGYDAVLGEYHDEASFDYYQDDIIHGEYVRYAEDESIAYQYREQRCFDGGLIRIIHVEPDEGTSYAMTLENTEDNYRATFYIGMDRDYFHYFTSAVDYDGSTLLRSGIVAPDGAITLYASFVTTLGDVTGKLDLQVNIIDEKVTSLTVTRYYFENKTPTMIDTVTETYSHEAKQPFPWNVVDWFNYQDYPSVG